MRKLFVVCILFLFIGYINAQVVENPVFDRTDVSSFRVQKVEVNKDTTYVYCLYYAEEDSWACLSDDTYLEDAKNGVRYPILKVKGIPFYPERRSFPEAITIPVVLYFPHISPDTNRISIIEDEENRGFNIYGIDLAHSYESSYTSEDIKYFFDSYEKEEEAENWASALEYTQKQLEATNYVEGIHSFASACSMYNMIMVFFGLKDYDKVIEWGKKAIDILQVLHQDSIYLDVLARTYGNVGSAYGVLRQYEMATQYMELSLAVRRQKEGVGALIYEEYLRVLAKKYHHEENYPKALLYGKEVADIYEKKYSENPYKYECVYINSLNNLCGFYHAMGKMNEAVKVGERALELNNRGRCKDYPWLKYEIYHNLASALISNGKADEGIKLLEAIKIASKNEEYNDYRVSIGARLKLASTYLYNKQDSIKALHEYELIKKELEDSLTVGKMDDQFYSDVLEKLYQISRWNNHDIAMQYLDKALKVQKEWHGERSIAYANLLLEKIRNLWVDALLEKKDLDNLLLYTKQVSDIIKRHINNSLFNMSKNERQNYWQRYEDFFTWFIPTISAILNKDECNSLAYDAALFYKGMLLSSERGFKNVIQSSNDNELVSLYQNYSSHLLEIEKWSSLGYNTDSLKSLIKEDEYLLSQKVTRFNSQYKGTDFSWREIKDKLKENEVAIEIISYRGINGEDTYYDAYVISSDSRAPRLVRLFGEEQLKSRINDSIDYEGLSILIWGNDELHDAIAGARNIYFSTSGLLNTIGIEYLPIDGNKFIYDFYNLYRLSSTRELCMSNDTAAIDNACLYGGLDYNSINDRAYQNDKNPFRLSRSAINSLVQRGSFDFLIGSMKEVEQVKSVLSSKKIECMVFSGSGGTEESFKSLSGRHLGIMHLSTHGMYISDDNESIRDRNNFRFIMSHETPDVDEEDISLSHSFLVMSGGNMIIRRDSVPTDNEDGILTALEISHLDFTNLDMVVLSACETALGRISSEGVYGLQRGFKKAGANTILMSLNKVDDEATRILMVEFYRNLINGKTKRQSLQEAQQYLRKVDNGKYDDPKYWASFILLDGLN